MNDSIFSNAPASLIAIDDSFDYAGVVANTGDGEYPYLVRLNAADGLPEFVAYNGYGAPQNTRYPAIQVRPQNVVCERYVNLYAAADGQSVVIGSKSWRTKSELDNLRDTGRRIGALKILWNITTNELVSAEQVA